MRRGLANARESKVLVLESFRAIYHTYKRKNLAVIADVVDLALAAKSVFFLASKCRRYLFPSVAAFTWRQLRGKGFLFVGEGRGHSEAPPRTRTQRTPRGYFFAAPASNFAKGTCEHARKQSIGPGHQPVCHDGETTISLSLRRKLYYRRGVHAIRRAAANRHSPTQASLTARAY